MTTDAWATPELDPLLLRDELDACVKEIETLRGELEALRGRSAPEGSVLGEAFRIVHGPRRAAYDHPARNMERTAQIWSAILGQPVSGRQVALCMIGVKLAREAHAPSLDNLVDSAGYAEVAWLCDADAAGHA